MEIFGITISWELLGTLLLFVLDLAFFLVAVFKKKVKVFDGTKEFILEHLPTCITLAERIDLDGIEKKVLAVNLINDLMRKAGIENTNEYQKFISQSIESILCTPQKKGVSLGYEKKKSES